MRKTKKEKLAAIGHRFKEFERIRAGLKFSPTDNKLTNKDGKGQTDSLPNLGSIENNKLSDKTWNLTDLSYLPTQLIRISLVTLALISVQIIIYFFMT